MHAASRLKFSEIMQARGQSPRPGGTRSPRPGGTCSPRPGGTRSPPPGTHSPRSKSLPGPSPPPGVELDDDGLPISYEALRQFALRQRDALEDAHARKGLQPSTWAVELSCVCT